MPMGPVMQPGRSLNDALSDWTALQGIGKKPRTQQYHAEIVGTIRRRWPLKCDTPVADITEQDVTAFAVSVAHYSASRFNGMVSTLKAILPAAKKLKRQRIVLKDRPQLTPRDVRRLLRALDARPQSYAGLVVRLLICTGLRINEARQLRWRDVGRDWILAPAAVTKSRKARAIPFVDWTPRTLKKLRRVTGQAEFILPQSQCRRALRTACRLAGLPLLSHHDFRHLFATRCIESGVDVPTAARWLGHQDGGALLGRTYFHLVDAHSRSMAARVRL